MDFSGLLSQPELNTAGTTKINESEMSDTLINEEKSAARENYN